MTVPLTVLVTGSSGLLGRSVAARLVSDGQAVRRHAGPQGPLADWRDELAVCEITDLRAMRNLCAGVDAVVHLAGPPSVAASFQNPETTYHGHVEGTRTVLRACRDARVTRLVYVSSAEVYGATGTERVTEDAPLNPRSPYGRAKVDAERLIAEAVDRIGVRAVVLRPFSVYGGASPETSIVGRILGAASVAPQVEVMSTHQIRDYVHVDDFAGAVHHALQPQDAPHVILNVCSGVGTSIADLIAMTLRAANRDVPVRVSSRADRPRSNDVDALIGDPTRASRTLGWQVQLSLEEGLARALRDRASDRAG